MDCMVVIPFVAYLCKRCLLLIMKAAEVVRKLHCRLEVVYKCVQRD
jgi:hypothetical protein